MSCLQANRLGIALFHTAFLLNTLAATLFSGALNGQTVTWSEFGNPAPRSFQGMAYDPMIKATMMFGGAGDGSLTFSDTWIWRGNWFLTHPSVSPSPRQGLAMAYDGASGTVVLFGGCSNNSPSCTYYNDTWTWDGKSWTQQFPSVSPSPRTSYMAYDETTKSVVLFGGTNTTTTLGDTWIWDGVTKTWTEKSPAASPSARLAPIAYDRGTGSIVLFGGAPLPPYAYPLEAYGDTWTWNGTTWTQLAPANSPSSRSGAGLAYDDALGKLVLFGGSVDGNFEQSANDTWTWDGTNWTEIYPSSVATNRYNFSMTYEPGFQALLMFGGFSTAEARGGTWFLEIAP